MAGGELEQTSGMSLDQHSLMSAILNGGNRKYCVPVLSRYPAFVDVSNTEWRGKESSTDGTLRSQHSLMSAILNGGLHSSGVKTRASPAFVDVSNTEWRYEIRNVVRYWEIPSIR